MFYPKLVFPTKSGRPFFYTNFVQTLDGKVAVTHPSSGGKKPGYWPIGSKADYGVLIELRTRADALIHGKNLANEFGLITQGSLNKLSFKRMRQKLGKNPKLPYIIATHDLKGLTRQLHKKGYKHVLVEGGPTLLGSFLKENLIDEIFLTLAPKIYGTETNKTLNLVEGYLFPEEATIKLKLLSVKQFESELFLRYKVLS